MKTLRCDGEHDLACGGQGINRCATCVFNLEDRKSVAFWGSYKRCVVAGACTLTWGRWQLRLKKWSGTFLGTGMVCGGTQNTLSSTFESLFSGCFVENGLKGGRRLEAANNMRSLGQQRCVTNACWVGQHLYLPTTPQRGPFYSPRHPRELSEFLMDGGCAGR